jgi:hypothetical protein
MSNVDEQSQAIILTQRLVEMLDENIPESLDKLRNILVEKQVAFSQAYAKNGESKLVLRWQQITLHIQQDKNSKIWTFYTLGAKKIRKKEVEYLTEGSLYISLKEHNESAANL